jgi:uncharacterized protein
MIRAVLDTNVVVSALLQPEGPTAIILDLAMSEYFRCYASEPLLEEYGEVLARARFRLDRRHIAKFLRRMRKTVVVVAPRKKLTATSDPDDNKVLECALDARADYVVTGNVRHFPARFQDIRVLLPRQFLTVLAAEPR